jgi:hypothetical protein
VPCVEGGGEPVASTRRRPRLVLLSGTVAAAVVVVLLLAGAGASGTGSGGGGTTATTQSVTGGPGTSLTIPLSSTLTSAQVPSVGYARPAPTQDPSAPGTVLHRGGDETDAFMYQSGGVYYLFMSKTGPNQPDVPVETATVPGDWSAPIDALPEFPAWAVPGWAWAPDVHQFGDQYVLYFTSLLKHTATMCIGAAVSSQITGPYTPLSTPFICQPELGGSIDPRTFVDASGKLYMVWKSDQDAVSHDTDTQVFSEPLSADGLHLLGQASVIFQPDRLWQGYIVEAPQLVVIQGAYYLFYSGNWFDQIAYAIGVARCAGPLGPCADTKPGPLLKTNSQGIGPGEESVFSDPNGIWMLYSPSHSDEPVRSMPRPTMITRLGFGPDGPYLATTPADPADT